MSRKSLLLGLVSVALVATLVFASAGANAQKKPQPERASGPPSLSLAADSTVIKGCNDESAHVRLAATARAADGTLLRYRWTANGGKLRGDGANTSWDLAGVQ